MGNPFMPSVAGSLNQAGQDTLLRLLQRRAFEEESMRRNVALQQDGGRNAFNVEMRLRDQKQQDDALNFRKGQAEEESRKDAAKAARAERDATNIRGAQDIFATGVQQGASREDLVRAAIDGKVPVSLMPKEPVAKPTLEEKAKEAETLAEARARGSKRGNPGAPKPTKVAKDTPGAPNSFRAAISGRKGTKGYTKAKEAFESVTARWQDWRRDYPNLDMSQVKSAIENVYGEDIPSEGAGISGDFKTRLLERMATRTTAK
jgi:hypothetical protein